ncbi:MAG: hypothetical protein CVT61_12400 [Actinobacteria bacterium HGW-Actinobacteria-11]|nr:MAG: hypothetical protein CVT61_12400 [Actinobacteria bacterium HGW-Actinobacteria-11]
MRVVAGIAMLLLLFVRGFVLWLLLPFSVVAWLLVHSWAQKARLRQAICWYDLNLFAFLMLVPLRPALRYVEGGKMRFVRISEMRVLETYGIGLTQLS